MLTHPTQDRLVTLGLTGMAKALSNGVIKLSALPWGHPWRRLSPQTPAVHCTVRGAGCARPVARARTLRDHALACKNARGRVSSSSKTAAVRARP
jgi:hypothetical protein